jgi:hypothetical protein
MLCKRGCEEDSRVCPIISIPAGESTKFLFLGCSFLDSVVCQIPTCPILCGDFGFFPLHLHRKSFENIAEAEVQSHDGPFLTADGLLPQPGSAAF